MITVDAVAGAALPALAIGMIGFSALVRPNARHDRVSREGGTVLLGEGLMNGAYTWIAWIADKAVRIGVRATAVSWVSLCFGLLAGLLAAKGRFGTSAWSLALSGLCDGLDGAVARRSGTDNPGGAVLDSALDRYVEFFFLSGLLAYFSGWTAIQMLVVAALFGGFMVTYSTAKAEALGVRPPRGWMKRPERLVWMTCGASLASACELAGWQPKWALIGSVSVIAFFANLSAVVRLSALARAARTSPRPLTASRANAPQEPASGR